MKKLLVLLLALCSAVATAQIKISGLPIGSTPVGTEIFPAVQTATTVALNLNQITTLVDGSQFGTDAGAANAYVVTLSQGNSVFSATTGALVRFVAANANTGASTLNVAGGGVKTVLSQNGVALTGGEIQTTGPTWVQYTGVAWQVVGTGATPDKVRTAAEITAAVIPVNYNQPELSVIRYVNNTVPGTTDTLPGFKAALAVANIYAGGVITIPAGAQGGGGAYFLSQEMNLPRDVVLQGADQRATFLLWSCLNCNGIVSLAPINSNTVVSRQLRNLSLGNTNVSNTGGGFVDVGGFFVELFNVRISGWKYSTIFDQTEVADVEYSDLESPSAAGVWMVNGSDHTPGVTFTAAPAANATSGTLTGNWAGTTGPYNLNFIETVGGAAESRTAVLTNGSAAVTWLVGLTNACNASTTAASQLFTNRLAVRSTEFNNVIGVGTGILDDGGNSHSFENNNFAGFVQYVRAAAVTSLNIIGGEYEQASAPGFLFTTTTSTGTNVGGSFGVVLQGLNPGSAGANSIINNVNAHAVKQLTVLGGYLGTNTANFTITGGSNIDSLDSIGAGWNAATAYLDSNPASYLVTDPILGLVNTNRKFNTASSVLSTGTGGVGYATGAGGAVTQITSRTTAVTLNTITGAVTMFSAAGSATAASFTVNDSQVAATDTIQLNQKSGTNLYSFLVTSVSAGSFVVTFFTTGGVAVDAPVINFTVVKGAAS